MFKVFKNQSGFGVVEVISMFIIIGIIGGTGWYVWQSRIKTNKTLDNTVSSQYNVQKSSPTTTPTPAVTAVNEVESLRTFCKGTDSNTEVGLLLYAENKNGKFGHCEVGIKNSGGGAIVISVYTNSKWAKIWSGNGTMEASLCTKYKIPVSIFSECTGNY
jgi:hypothetical protein